MFVAHQIVADLEELLSIDGDTYASPFFGELVCPGYGGKSGFSVIDHELLFWQMLKSVGSSSLPSQRSEALLLRIQAQAQSPPKGAQYCS